MALVLRVRCASYAVNLRMPGQQIHFDKDDEWLFSQTTHKLVADFALSSAAVSDLLREFERQNLDMSFATAASANRMSHMWDYASFSEIKTPNHSLANTIVCASLSGSS